MKKHTRSICRVCLILGCLAPAFFAAPKAVQAQRIRVPFVDVDRYGGQVRVRTPFMRVYRGADGVSVSTPFYRVDVPRRYSVGNPGPIQSPFQPVNSPFMIQVEVPEGTRVQVPALPAQQQVPQQSATAVPQTTASAKSGTTWQASRTQPANATANTDAPAFDGTIDDSEYTEAVVVKKRGTDPSLGKASDSLEEAPQADETLENKSTEAPTQPVLKTPEHPVLLTGAGAASTTQTTREKSVVANKPAQSGDGGPLHQLIFPMASQSSRPQIRTGVVSLPQQPRGQVAIQQGERGKYFLTPIDHTRIREVFAPAEGTHILALRHPFTRQAFGVEVRLPAGNPQIKVKSDEIEFDYGEAEIELEFNRDGSVSIDYD